MLRRRNWSPDYDLAAFGVRLDALAAAVHLLTEVTNTGVRSLHVIAIYQDFAGVGRGIDFNLGRLRKFDANAARDGTQPPIVVRRPLYAQVSPGGRAYKAASCDAHLNSSGPLFHGSLGRPHNHKNDVAVSCLGIYPLKRANAGYGAVA